MSTANLTVDVREFPPVRARHRHNFSQVIIPIQGSLRIAIEGDWGDVVTGQVAIVPPEHVHDFEGRYGGRYLVVDWYLDQPEEPAFRRLLGLAPRLKFSVSPFWRRFFDLVSQEMLTGAQAKCDFANMIRAGLQMIDSTAPVQNLPRNVERIHQMAETYGAHGRDHRAIPDLARENAMSQSRFYDHFREQTGQSPKQFMISRVLEQAQARLINSSDSITTIATSLGYENPNSFTRIFRRHVGMTPTQFRAAGRSTD